MMLEAFGGEYLDYMRRTGQFLLEGAFAKNCSRKLAFTAAPQDVIIGSGFFLCANFRLGSDFLWQGLKK